MDAGIQLEKISENDLLLDVLPEATRQVLEILAESEFMTAEDWYLAGGTALALQAGHRQSVDLDFFTERREFDEILLEKNLMRIGDSEITMREKGILYSEIKRTQVSFIANPSFKPSGKQLVYKNIRILPIADIAAMKIIAVSQRGRKRDFMDLYWYCHEHQQGLDEVIQSALRQYPQKHNLPHILKSLMYFDEAEDDPMPRLQFDAAWTDVKSFFMSEVPHISKILLGL